MQRGDGGECLMQTMLQRETRSLKDLKEPAGLERGKLFDEEGEEGTGRFQGYAGLGGPRAVGSY